MGIHAGTLSQIINGKRALPLKDSRLFIKKLKLSANEKALFIESLYKKKPALDAIKISDEDSRIIIDESYYKIIVEWEHLALIELFDVKGFERTVEDAALKLDLTMNRAEVVVNNLSIAGLIQKTEDGRLERTHGSVKTSSEIASRAIKDAHRETLKMASDRIEEIEVELRDFSSITLAIDPEKMSEAKVLIKEFRQKFDKLLSQDENRTDIYRLAIQFFPLVKNKKRVLH